MDLGGGVFLVVVFVIYMIFLLCVEYGEFEVGVEIGVIVGVVGCVVFSCNIGKFCFVMFQVGDGFCIQVMILFVNVGEELLVDWKEYVDLGDYVFVYGEVIFSCCGELLIMVDDWVIVVKVILLFFNVYVEFSEEGCVCSCYFDLIVCEQVCIIVCVCVVVNVSL